MKKLLVADSYDSFTFNLIQLIDQHKGYQYTLVETDRLNLDEVKEFDKILLTPGPGLPRESGKLMELIEYYASTKSILGVCLGHQAIAQVFGAQLYQLPQVLHGLTQTMQVTTQGKQSVLFARLPPQMSIGLYHSWVVLPNSLPKELEVTGTLETISTALPHLEHLNKLEHPLVMAFQHQSLDLHGIQFHPESIMTDFGREILYNWLDV